MIEIDPKDRVSILGQDGMTVRTGEVISAHNYGTDVEPDWYIELTDDSTGYCYWKQSLDGGTVKKLPQPRLTLLKEYKIRDHEYDQIQDAVLETIYILTEIPGVREALTVAAVERFGDWPIKYYADNTMVGGNVADLPIDYAYRYVMDPDENEKGEQHGHLE